MLCCPQRQGSQPLYLRKRAVGLKPNSLTTGCSLNRLCSCCSQRYLRALGNRPVLASAACSAWGNAWGERPKARCRDKHRCRGGATQHGKCCRRTRNQNPLALGRGVCQCVGSFLGSPLGSALSSRTSAGTGGYGASLFARKAHNPHSAAGGPRPGQTLREQVRRARELRGN